jgi:hypothetical protein
MSAVQTVVVREMRYRDTENDFIQLVVGFAVR